MLSNTRGKGGGALVFAVWAYPLGYGFQVILMEDIECISPRFPERHVLVTDLVYIGGEGFITLPNLK